MAEPGRWPYRDAAGAARLARWLLGLQALSSLLSALLPQLDSPALALAFAPVQLVAYAATAIFVLRWLYLASGNARALGATDLMGSPGWAVGWFFIPLLNLVMPFGTMRDMWKASANPKDWQAASAPAIIALWWACWIAANLAGATAFALSLEAPKETQGATALFALASSLLLVPTALLLAFIVARIQAMQEKAWPASVY